MGPALLCLQQYVLCFYKRFRKALFTVSPILLVHSSSGNLVCFDWDLVFVCWKEFRLVSQSSNSFPTYSLSLLVTGAQDTKSLASGCRWTIWLGCDKVSPYGLLALIQALIIFDLFEVLICVTHTAFVWTSFLLFNILFLLTIQTSACLLLLLFYSEHFRFLFWASNCGVALSSTLGSYLSTPLFTTALARYSEITVPKGEHSSRCPGKACPPERAAQFKSGVYSFWQFCFFWPGYFALACAAYHMCLIRQASFKNAALERVLCISFWSSICLGPLCLLALVTSSGGKTHKNLCCWQRFFLHQS